MRYDNGMVQRSVANVIAAAAGSKGNDSTRESRWEGAEGGGEEISIWWFLQRAGGPPCIYVSSSFLCRVNRQLSV